MNCYLIKTAREDCRRHVCPELLFNVGRKGCLGELDNLISLCSKAMNATLNHRLQTWSVNVLTRCRLAISRATRGMSLDPKSLVIQFHPTLNESSKEEYFNILSRTILSTSEENFRDLNSSSSNQFTEERTDIVYHPKTWHRLCLILNKLYFLWNMYSINKHDLVTLLFLISNTK